jgi:hypothetical protein
MSLISLINNELKTKFPQVYKAKNDRLSSFFTWVYSQNFKKILLSYFALILSVSTYTAFIDFDFLKIIEINFIDSVKTFTTGLITLVSMNLFVTNLLLTHLKEHREEIQSILDKKVNFKFITYFGFTLIISVLTLYFLNQNIQNENIKCNILILMFFSFISYILMLISLYNNVFNFINKNTRDEIIKSELKREFNIAFYKNYFKRRFNEEYINLMENKLNFKRYSTWNDIEGLNHYELTLTKNQYLKDINIKKISRIHKKTNTSEKYYHFLELGKLYQKNTTNKLFSLPAKENFKYKKAYIFSTENTLKDEFNQENLDILLKKVNDNTLSNRYNDLSSNLKNLEEIYNEYIELENEI